MVQYLSAGCYKLRDRRGFDASEKPQHTRFCREISFVAVYALLGVPFSAIHGDEWLFHDNASSGLLMQAQGCQC